jgi:serine protease inhibitor ecotin
VHLEASTKPHVHNLIHEFLINMAFTMACPNFKKGLKMVSGPLGVNSKLQHYGPCKIS